MASVEYQVTMAVIPNLSIHLHTHQPSIFIVSPSHGRLFGLSARPFGFLVVKTGNAPGLR